jgi:hypothetical protein
MRELFALAPGARLESALATYDGRAAFERDHPDTYFARSGYMGFTSEAAAALPCDCRG